MSRTTRSFPGATPLPYVAMVTLSCLLVSCSAISSSTNAGADSLPACTKKDTPFEEVAPWETKEKSWGGLQWIDGYHARVSAVVDEYMRYLGLDLDNDDALLSDTVLRCAEEDFRSVTPAGPLLLALAAELQPWRGKSIDDLSAADAPAVLLEYLRELECALKEEEMQGEMGVLRDAPNISKNVGQSMLMTETQRRKNAIEEQIALLRPSLERTLLLLSGLGRLRPLLADIECIERASLDLRNVASLLPESASCAVRATDNVSPLRF